MTDTPASPPFSRPAYPATFDLDSPLAVARWRPFVHWFLAIPHYVVLYALGIASAVVWMISFFTVLFTRRIPDGLFAFQVMVLRYGNRVGTYAMFLREPYPAFDFTTSTADPGGDPARTSIENPGELNRWLPLVKWLLIIPHMIVLALMGIGVFFVGLVSAVYVLVTGQWPPGMRQFLVGYLRWYTRVNAYAYLLTDVYPPFTVD